MKFGSSQQKILEDILTWRRDVRHFRTDPIERETLEAIEASVDLAPSVGNSRPWRFVRVTSGTKRNAVISSFEKSNEDAASAYITEEATAYRALKLAGLKEAPVHIAAFTVQNPVEGRGLGRQTMPEMLAYSTVGAINTLWLAARSHNVGVGWVSILDPDTVSAVLDVPKEWLLTGYLCLGYPVEDHDTPELQRTGWQDNTETVWLDR